MSAATVYSDSQFGMDDEVSIGLYAGSASFTSTSQVAEAMDHNGAVVAAAVYDMRMEVTLDGVVKTAGTAPGGGATIGDTITIANQTHNRNRAADFTASGGITVLTGGSMTPSSTGFRLAT
jgi:hypothetical protein